VASALALATVVGTTFYIINRDPESSQSTRIITNTTQSPPAETEDPPAESTPPASPTEAASSPAETGQPTTDPGGDLEIPAAFAGTWSGHTTTTNPTDTDGADNKVVLKRGDATAAWWEEDPDEKCAGTITLTKVERTRLTFALGQNEGGCIPGTIWLDLRGDTLAYTWRDVPGLGLVTQTGALKKS
jgi:hypothetical protein